jgi:hypothetical protein
MPRQLWGFLRQPPDFAVFSCFCKKFVTIALFALAGAALPP